MNRSQLAAINRFFEVRPWLHFSQQGMRRLEFSALASYHEQHEIPRKWYCWDYTLSWLISANHPPPAHKFVIFNHLQEDEPPQEAIASHPWMAPLLRYPVSRSTMASIVEYLVKAKAAAIVLDNDFPQYSADDRVLAAAIHDAASGAFGRKVPVLFASTFTLRATPHFVMMQAGNQPSGVLDELQKLEPDVDVRAKYTGLVSVALDEDLVARRLVTRFDGQGKALRSLPLALLQELGEQLPADLPSMMDIDFACAAENEVYPIRPFNYLLDPRHRAAMLAQSGPDVTIPGAIVIIGDGVTDVHPTPLINQGIDCMSGSELLTNAVDTISRRSWPLRLTGLSKLAYILICLLTGSLAAAAARRYRLPTARILLRAIGEVFVYLLLIAALYALPFLLFAWLRLIAPVYVPCLALALGIACALVVERETSQLRQLQARLSSAQRMYDAQMLACATQLEVQKVQAQADHLARQSRTRREFVRRLNHDLKAPVTVLNWTLAKLKAEGLTSSKAAMRLLQLERTSDRLFDLLAELVRTYDGSVAGGCASARHDTCDLRQLLKNSGEVSSALFEAHASVLVAEVPMRPLPVSGRAGDMQRVFDNLLNNAVQHNPPGTAVHISAHVQGNIVCVCVSDDGVGMDFATLKRIFDAGHHAGVYHEGEGLGLSIAATLVESMGGTITATSQPGRGSCFTVCLPLARQPAGESLDFEPVPNREVPVCESP